jgi:hypothetical protein
LSVEQSPLLRTARLEERITVAAGVMKDRPLWQSDGEPKFGLARFDQEGQARAMLSCIGKRRDITGSARIGTVTVLLVTVFTSAWRSEISPPAFLVSRAILRQ